jgi:hypothetical protein
VLDRCLIEEPELRPVGEDGYHGSACWLPARSAGLGERAEQLRAETVREGRGEAAAEVYEAEIAGVPELSLGSEGSVVE